MRSPMLLAALLLAPLVALNAADALAESSDRVVNAGDYGLKNIPIDRWDVKLFPDNPDSTDAIQAACDAGAGTVSAGPPPSKPGDQK